MPGKGVRHDRFCFMYADVDLLGSFVQRQWSQQEGQVSAVAVLLNVVLDLFSRRW